MLTQTVQTHTVRAGSPPGYGDTPPVYQIDASVHASIVIDAPNLETARAKLIEDLIDRARTLRISIPGVRS